MIISCLPLMTGIMEVICIVNCKYKAAKGNLKKRKLVNLTIDKDM